jgi:hypothetical protein
MEDYYRAAKIFLQTIFCLPNSFPISVAQSLLRLQFFDATILERRIRFLERAYISTSGVPTVKALDYDQEVLRNHHVGFSHDLFSFLATFFDTTDLENLSIRDLAQLQDLRDQIVIQRSLEFRSSFSRSSGLNFFPVLSDDAMMPLQFGEFIGSIDYEQARVVLLCLGDVFRYSLSATSSRCPFCPTELHLFHLFNCPNCSFRSSLPRWAEFVQHFQSGNWLAFITMLFLCLQGWDRGSHFFHSRASARINDFSP